MTLKPTFWSKIEHFRSGKDPVVQFLIFYEFFDEIMPIEREKVESFSVHLSITAI